MDIKRLYRGIQARLPFKLTSQQRRVRLAKERATLGRNRDSSATKIWNVVNRPFVLFLFSSVILTTLSKLWADHQARLVEQAASAKSVESLLTEIGNRYENLKDNVGHLQVDLFKFDLDHPTVLSEDIQNCAVSFAPWLEEFKDMYRRDQRKRGVALITAPFVDPHSLSELRDIIKAYSAPVLSTFNGTAPYAATDPTYSNVNMTVLVNRLDDFKGDTLGSKGIVISDERKFVVEAVPILKAENSIIEANSACAVSAALRGVKDYLWVRRENISCSKFHRIRQIESSNLEDYSCETVENSE